MREFVEKLTVYPESTHQSENLLHNVETLQAQKTSIFMVNFKILKKSVVKYEDVTDSTESSNRTSSRQPARSLLFHRKPQEREVMTAMKRTSKVIS